MQKYVPISIELLEEIRDKGLIYWEPQTERGFVARTEMVNRINLVLSQAPAYPAVVEDAQTINSAPKDKAILVYSFGWEKAHYNTAYEKWIGHGYDTSDTNLLNLHPPTHWRPLPPDPTALASIPTPTVGRAEALEEAAKICKAESLRWFAKSDAGSTLTYIMQCQSRAETAKECGNKIRALSYAPTPQAVTVDDAAVERAMLAYKQFDEPINGGNEDGIYSWAVGGKFFPNWDKAAAYLEVLKMRAALAAAFPQRREK